MSNRQTFVNPARGHDMPFCDSVLVGDTLYLSGAIGWDTATKKLPPNFDDECRQALKNVGGVLKDAGFDYGDVVKALAFITDFSLFPEWNRVYQEFFSAPYPARSTVGVASLALGARLEVEMIAVKRT
jgi:2-iminobutanoate/2-iminopropanoate deaminase